MSPHGILGGRCFITATRGKGTRRGPLAQRQWEAASRRPFLPGRQPTRQNGKGTQAQAQPAAEAGPNHESGKKEPPAQIDPALNRANAPVPHYLSCIPAGSTTWLDGNGWKDLTLQLPKLLTHPSPEAPTAKRRPQSTTGRFVARQISRWLLRDLSASSVRLNVIEVRRACAVGEGMRPRQRQEQKCVRWQVCAEGSELFVPSHG